MVSAPDVVVEVKLPQALLVGSGLTRQEAGDALLRSYVISLYRRDKISSGKAARLLGIHRLSFIRILSEEGIPYLDYTSEEFDREVEAVREWSEAKSSPTQLTALPQSSPCHRRRAT